ncbi:aldose-1-epimerase [Citrobacter farmeri]|uniref:Aldose epimerase n=1 Tax=Citrobacter amalonaticus Y19 TaxID=1261127 RepID=A0A0F6TY53_CITAM|nr:aldose-1-epimerase [Citrobacter amalonaticus]AKE60859.1 aldose epimerase [Citrobacter amalonaticus Y19]EKV5657057.1 aldose-1-epimerase [Citrobacter farmeri]
MQSSGNTISLAAGDYRAQIVSVGAGLAELTWQGKHLVIPHSPEEMPLAHLGKVLIPWPNRIANGCYQHEGQDYQLPINEHHSQAAIHGLLAWRDWQIEALTATKATLTLFLPPSYGYPFTLMSQVIYSLDAETGLSVAIISKNRGKQPAPYGVGIHPYLTCNLAPVDDCMLRIPAKQVFAVDAHANPTTLYSVEEMDLDYSILRTVGDKHIDHTFRTHGSPWEMQIIHQQQALAVSLFSDQPWLQIYSGEKLNRQGLAVEPMSCPPNAFNSGTDLILLKPEEKHQLFFNIRGKKQQCNNSFNTKSSPSRN